LIFSCKIPYSFAFLRTALFLLLQSYYQKLQYKSTATYQDILKYSLLGVGYVQKLF